MEDKFLADISQALKVREAEIIGRAIKWRSYYVYFNDAFDSAYASNGYDPKLKGTPKYLAAFRSYVGSSALLVLNYPNIIKRKGKYALEKMVNAYINEFPKREDWKVFTKSNEVLFNTINFIILFEQLEEKQEMCLQYIADFFSKEGDIYLQKPKKIPTESIAKPKSYRLEKLIIEEAFGL